MRPVLLASTLLLAMAAVHLAQDHVGAVNALQGTAYVLHPPQAARVPLKLADAVLLADEVSTSTASKLRLELVEGSVLTLGANSQMTLDELALGPGFKESRVSLLGGTARAVTSDQYHESSKTFALRTPTAVVSVAGTGFIVRYEENRATTVVLGLYDTTLVRSAGDPQGRNEVRLLPGQVTEVERGKRPTRPVPIDEERRRDLLESTELLTGPPAASAQRDDDLAFCVAETNRYRARHGMPPLRRSAELEAYAAAGARYDTAVRIPHKHFDDTPGGHLAYAENQCLSFQGWSLRRAGGSVQGAITKCLRTFYDEGPGGGHYQNMLGGEYGTVGCAVHVTGDGVTIVQDFGR